MATNRKSRQDETGIAVLFSNSGVFAKAASQACSKAFMAAGNVLNLCYNSKVSSWESKIKLNEALISSVLLYGTQLWGT